MKKIILVMAAAVAVSLVSCNNNTDYKAKGEEFANELEKLCEMNDTAGIVALDDSIRVVDDELVAAGDTANLNAFRSGLRDIRDKVAPFITVAKMQSGTSKDEAVQDVIDDVLNGNGGDVSTVTRSISAALEQEKKNGLQKKENKDNSRRQRQTR